MSRSIHGWMSRRVFIPWVIHGPWSKNRRRYLTALADARNAFSAWAAEGPDERRQRTLQYLRAIVRLSGERVPYYRKLFKENGFDHNDDWSFSDFSNLPALEKETIRDQPSELIADGYAIESMFEKSTGGSTGAPLRFWQDEGDRAWADASSEWLFRQVGYHPGDRLGLLWGANVEAHMQENTKARLLNWLSNQQTNDCFRLSPEILDRIHSRLTAFQPEFLRCYASALVLHALRLHELGAKPTYPRCGIITGAEKLRSEQRAIVESVFSAPVYESYGSRDCGLMAIQLEPSEPRLRISSPYVYIETIGPRDPISGYELAITILHRRGMPFLRYRIGDRARFENRDTDTPIEYLSEIVGRTLDHITLPDGRLIHSSQFPHLFKDYDIREYQVIQSADGKVMVSIIPGAQLSSDDLSRVEQILSANLSPVELSITCVNEIARNATGKLRSVMSMYQPPEQ